MGKLIPPVQALVLSVLISSLTVMTVTGNSLTFERVLKDLYKDCAPAATRCLAMLNKHMSNRRDFIFKTCQKRINRCMKKTYGVLIMGKVPPGVTIH
ncbi:hypothetical protein ScPMuIL_017160 [Solemya velum]